MDNDTISTSAAPLLVATKQAELESSPELLKKAYEKETRELVDHLSKTGCGYREFDNYYVLRYANSTLYLLRKSDGGISAQLLLRTQRLGELSLQFSAGAPGNEQNVTVRLEYFLSRVGPALGWRVPKEGGMGTSLLAEFCLTGLLNYATDQINSRLRNVGADPTAI